MLNRVLACSDVLEFLLFNSGIARSVSDLRGNLIVSRSRLKLFFFTYEVGSLGRAETKARRLNLLVVLTVVRTGSGNSFLFFHVGAAVSSLGAHSEGRRFGHVFVVQML
jgi:hypothetical protein